MRAEQKTAKWSYRGRLPPCDRGDHGQRCLSDGRASHLRRKDAGSNGRREGVQILIMKALVIAEKDALPVWTSVADPVAGSSEPIVGGYAAAWNHRDGR